VNYLLGKGADVDQKQAAGYSPLHIAVLSGTSLPVTV
jgi:ankyrin repeat protein